MASYLSVPLLPAASSQVTVGSLDLRANTAITQIVEVVTDYDKYNKLCDHLRNYSDGSRVLIFVETKKGCDQLTRSLIGQRHPARCIHGDKTQQERDATLADFKVRDFYAVVLTHDAACPLNPHPRFASLALHRPGASRSSSRRTWRRVAWT